MIKAVVFDLDDTLISEKEYVLSGFKTVSKDISFKYNLNFEKVYEKMIVLFNESSQKVFDRILESFDIEYSKEDIVNLISIYRRHEPKIKFYDDVMPTIDKLKQIGIKIGIITDGYKETQRRKIKALRCEDLFDEIIVTDELGREFWKPHEKAYRIIAEKLDVKLHEMIYVGDNDTKDFIGANGLNINTVKINRLNGIYRNLNISEEFKAKYEIGDIVDLIKLIREEERVNDEKNIIYNYC